jgi:hypothetical protein
MAAKRKSALNSTGQSGIPSPSDGLGPALAPIATARTEELAALLAAVLDGRKKKTLDRLSQALSDAVPELLKRAVEQELLAGGEVATYRRAALVSALSAGETSPRRTSTKQTPVADADGSTDWMSAKSVAKLLNVSPAHVRKLAKAGELGELDAYGSGVARLERVAVLAYYNGMKRRQRTGLKKMVDANKRSDL